MSYKSILGIWDGKKSSLAALNTAMELTSAADGHLHIICPAYIRVPSHDGFPYSELPTSLSISEREGAMEKVDKLKPEAEKLAKNYSISFSVEAPILNRDQLGGFMANAARFCDLVVLPQPFGSDRGTADEKITEGTLLSSACPILIVPETMQKKVNMNAVIAWDGSDESLHAVRAAMPFLRQAENVDVITVCNKNKKDVQGSTTELALFLSRHRINSNINILPKTLPKVSDEIRTRAKHLNADLIIMGGYSHSPLREFFFGGATREMMHKSDIPILMAH